MKNVKIVEQVSKDTFLVKIDKYDPLKYVGVAHDFVEFGGFSHLSTEGGLSINHGSHRSNIIAVNTSVQIPIRMFKKFVLNFLNEHPNLQDEHLIDREYSKDDEYNNPPKYKKGDTYPAYAYHNHTAIYFYDRNRGEYMVSVLEKGEREPNIVTLSFYNKYIKPNIQ